MSINIVSKFDVKVSQAKNRVVKLNKNLSLFSSEFGDSLSKDVKVKNVKVHTPNDVNNKHHEKLKTHCTGKTLKSSLVNNCNTNINKLNIGKSFVGKTDENKLKDIESGISDNTLALLSLTNDITKNISSALLSQKFAPTENGGYEVKSNLNNFSHSISQENNSNRELVTLQKDKINTSALSFEKIERNIINNSTLGKIDDGMNPSTTATQLTAATNNITHPDGISEPITIHPSSPVLEQAKALLKPIREHIKFQLDHDIKSASLHLDPPQMGRVDLNIRLDGDKLYVQMHALNNQIRDALQSGLDRLRNDLSNNYQGDIQLDVTSDNGSYQSKHNKQNQYVSIRNSIALNRSDINQLEPSQESMSPNVTRFGQINYFA